MSNLAHELQGTHLEIRKYEMLGGKWVAMARPTTNHNKVRGNIETIFTNFLKGRKCSVYGETSVFLSDEEKPVPDVAVVCDRDKVKDDGIHGAPDLVIEVLSPSTAKKDKGYKMRLYERFGVKELWLVSVTERSVEVYRNIDGKFELFDIYIKVPAFEIEPLSDELKSQYKTEFKTLLFDDLIIKIEDVFDEMV